MAAVMDDYLDSPMDNEDVFPCKGCGDILEEGKAFELGMSSHLSSLLPIALPHGATQYMLAPLTNLSCPPALASGHVVTCAMPSIISKFHPANTDASPSAGNRWHLNCFRCNTCGTLLDSDANLLLLGDGSLICNSCTYSCNACGSKIEELAILTGDQAFCATCFRCRNCKRKIENLRYARTSQGIFCMSCHESLMARRRKKSKAAAQSKSREKDSSPMITDKSLPALPPNAIPPNAFSDTRVDPESDTPTELSPRPRAAYRNDADSRGSSRPARSPERSTENSGKETGLGLPAASYRNNRNSAIIAPPDLNGGDGDSFFIPVALDPTPATSTPRSMSDNLNDPAKKKERDYFSVNRTNSQKRTESQSSTPHIAFQEKGRQSSSELEHAKLPSRKASTSSRKDSAAALKPSPATDEKSQRTVASNPQSINEDFRLQDAPKSKKAASSRSNTSPTLQSDNGSAKGSNGVSRREPPSESPPRPSIGDMSGTSRSSLDSRRRDEDDLRPSLDSMPSSRPDGTPNKPIARKELPATASRIAPSKPHSNSLSRTVTEESAPPSKLAPSRPPMTEQKLSDSYMQPRKAPPHPGAPGASPLPSKEPVGTPGDGKTDGKTDKEKHSPKLPRWSSGGDFTMDEDMARILGTDEGSSSILRRVSNAVRHGRTNSTEASHPPQRASGHTRSVSETTRGTASPRWPKTPMVLEDPSPGHEISSPISLHSSDDPAFLKRQLRNSEQRVAELERQFNTEKDLKHLNKKLVEKRKTVSTLDTQTEIMIRQLEVLAGYVEKAKETKTPVDPRDLEDSAIKDFVQKLDKVKETMSEAIEVLHEERDELVEEKNKERFKSQIGDLKSPSGLGIYSQNKGLSGSSLNLAGDNGSMTTGTTLMAHDNEEPAVVEARPQVVDIRKGQVKKFNWKKGTKMAQNVSKGLNRAVVAFQQEREGRQHPGLTADNIGMPYNMTVSQVEAPAAITPNGPNRPPPNQGFGFFKKDKMPKSMSANNLSAQTVPEAPSVLFGSDLADRADYERRQIPSVVTRCIEEVELRGMDVEGIYRKTGGNSQVKIIQEGFDKNEDYDISDPELDITAVTSVLKQYFRKLPQPLLTYEIYDQILQSNAFADTPTERCDFLRKTFALMPQQHRDCLEFLMFHLARVAKREPENLMSPKNLAVVFAPTIMRDTSLEREMTDMHAKNLAVQFVIENSHTIFTE
ncbi:rho-type GTPase-activating protein [Verticillium dahliae VdLs.17]|uniref:Rho-type GTPase-activating protein n=2 Tax=Verticillium TaxID=1036719 RepID=G2WSB5_VERDV|nr:rho-type GTPase-activating protein [Verticillium dahliae VdLs.17]EGY13766.1 rho-type GTPase-activating protein [Verticillium dahliae VdLs.17]